MATAIFYILCTACLYVTLYRLLVLCPYVQSCLLQSSTGCRYVTIYRFLVLCLSVHCCVLQFVVCLSVPHTQQSVYSLSVPYTKKSVHSLSVPHIIPSFGSVSVCPLLFSKVCPLSVSTSHSPPLGFVSLSPLLPLQSFHCMSVLFFNLNRLLITLLQ